MALSIVTTPTLTVNVGSLFSYSVSAVQDGSLGGVSALHHFQLSGSTGPADTTRVSLVSATDGSALVLWTPRVSDVVLSATGTESLALTLSVYNISGAFANQAISISADFTSAYKKRTNIGDGGGENNSDIADFYMRGLGKG